MHSTTGARTMYSTTGIGATYTTSAGATQETADAGAMYSTTGGAMVTSGARATYDTDVVTMCHVGAGAMNSTTGTCSPPLVLTRFAPPLVLTQCTRLEMVPLRNGWCCRDEIHP